jgi:hypothetical protein
MAGDGSGGGVSNYTALMCSIAALTAACSAGRTMTAGGELAPVRPINANWLPAGTSLTTRLDQSISTVSSRSGDSFSATVLNPVFAQDGTIAVPAGSLLRGHITGIHVSSAPDERSLIRLAFDDIQMRGVTYPVTASVSNVVVERQTTVPLESPAPRNAVVGAAPDAAIGGIVSGAALSKVLSAGLLGAATGTVISLGAGGTESILPAGSALNVRTNEPVRFR